MSILILYASKHGCTEECAAKIAAQLGSSDVIHVRKADSPLLENYSTVILGGSIHAGRIQGRLRKFAEKNTSLLLTKKLGLFICCMEEGEKAEQQLQAAFPASLRDHATVTACLGGAFRFERMNPLERAIIRKISGTDTNVEKIDETKIGEFVKAMNG